MTLKKFLLACIIIPFMTACNANIQLTMDENYSYLTVTMTEESVENLIETLLTSGQSRLENVTADLRAGEIYVTGDAQTNNGLQSGSLVVDIGTQNGLLDVEVQSFNFGVFSAQQAGIDDFNQRLANNIASNARNNNNDSEFTQVNITSTGLSFTIRSPRPNRQ